MRHAPANINRSGTTKRKVVSMRTGCVQSATPNPFALPLITHVLVCGRNCWFFARRKPKGSSSLVANARTVRTIFETSWDCKEKGQKATRFPVSKKSTWNIRKLDFCRRETCKNNKKKVEEEKR